MIWYIVAVILTIVLILYSTNEWIQTIKRKREAKKKNYKYYESDDDCNFGWWLFSVIVFPAFLFMIAFFINFLSGCIIWDICPETHEHYKASDFEIVAFKDNIAESGRIYLTHGYFEDDLYYFYLKETSNGLKQGKIRADCTYINYTDKDPHVECFKQKFKDDVKWVKFFTTVENGGGNYYYKAYVPEGTVEKDFRIDLE